MVLILGIAMVLIWDLMVLITITLSPFIIVVSTIFLLFFSYCKEIFISFVGTDAGKFDYVDVFTQNHSYKCAFSKLLDYNDHEVGHDCHQTG